MGIIAWIILGLASGLIASRLLPGRRAQGAGLNCAIGVSGALLGGWAAASLLHLRTLNSFFDPSTWLTAFIGAVVLLLAYHALSERPNLTGRNGKSVPAVVPVRQGDTSR